MHFCVHIQKRNSDKDTLLCPQTEEKFWQRHTSVSTDRSETLKKTSFCVHRQKRNSDAPLCPQTEEKFWQRHASVSTDRRETLTKNECLGIIRNLCFWTSAGFKYFRHIAIKFSHLNHCRTNHRKLRSVLARNVETHLEKSTNHIILRAESAGIMWLFNGSLYSEL